MNTLTPDQQPEKWSAIAQDYQRAFESLTQQFADEAIRQLKPKAGECVIDVAAGTGAFSLAIAKTGVEVLATDFAAGMVKQLQQRVHQAKLKQIKTAVMDGQALDVADASFDISASIVGLIFFADIDKGFAELKRVLKPEGRCAVVCWDFPENFDMMRLLKQAIETALPNFVMPNQTPVWARLVGTQALVEKFELAGFKNIKVETKQGQLVLNNVANFWSAFISSSPPMMTLFKTLGTEKTKKVGEAFVNLATDNGKNKTVTLLSQACIGVATV